VNDDIAAAEAKLKDLNAKIKNKENELRQVCDACQAIRNRLDKYESELSKLMRG
jgi:chromosome segregation ATPase